MPVDVLDLARIQFALTISFHFIFPSITIGLSGFIAVVETLRWYTNREVFDRMSVFLTKLFAVTFVIGVVTGVVMEFQFGTNWSRFSGYVGDIFGAPLAAEGIFAFFLESAFIGIVLFGRDRVSSTVRWISGVLVAFGTLLSAFWILVANSWMQTPAGYTCYPDANNCATATKVLLTDFWAAVLNPSTLVRVLHTVSACYVAGAFFLLGVCAFYFLRKRDLDVARIGITMAIIVAFLGSGSMFLSGDLQTREVAANQPLKFAAMEGVCKTSTQVPLDIIGIPPAQSCVGEGGLAIAIPYGLSLMMTGNVDGAIKGLDQSDPSLWPPIAATYMGFRIMVGLGALMALLMLIGAFFLWRRSYESHRWWLWAAVLAMPLPIIAIELGWMVAEVGRQPWIVQGLLRTSQATSPGVTSGDVLVSLGGILALYTLLFGLWVYELRKEILRGPGLAPDDLFDASAAMQNEGGR